MKNKRLIWLLAAVLVKGLIWILLTPIFQVPDEPSHFALVQFLAEQGRRPHPRREVVTSEAVLRLAEAVNFDWRVIHPVWRGYDRDWRQQAAAITPAQQQTWIKNDYQQSLKRPALYYWLAAPVYRLAGQSFLAAFLATRLVNLVLELIVVWLVFLTAKTVFKSVELGLAAAALVGFQPMLSFVAAGIHYDVLAVLVVTLFGYWLAVKKRLLALAAALIGLLVKPDLIFLPLVWLKRGFWLGLGLAFGLLVWLAGPLAGWAGGWTDRYDWLIYQFNLNELTGAAAWFWSRFIQGKIFTDAAAYLTAAWPAHSAQIFPWYWGTFGWLEAPLPGWVFAGIKLAVLASLFGWLKFIHQHGFPRKMLFWLGLVVVQAAVVMANDFQFFAARGEVYGIQGRYFFPAICAQMMLLLFGWRQWLSARRLLAAALIFAVGLNLAGLVTVYRYFGWVWGS
jgi:hypothetical protein